MPAGTHAVEAWPARSRPTPIDVRARRILACLTTPQRRVLLALHHGEPTRPQCLEAQPLTLRKLADFGLLEPIIGGLRLTDLGRYVQDAAQQP